MLTTRFARNLLRTPTVISYLSAAEELKKTMFKRLNAIKRNIFVIDYSQLLKTHIFLLKLLLSNLTTVKRPKISNGLRGWEIEDQLRDGKKGEEEEEEGEEKSNKKERGEEKGRAHFFLYMSLRWQSEQDATDRPFRFSRKWEFINVLG